MRPLTVCALTILAVAACEGNSDEMVSETTTSTSSEDESAESSQSTSSATSSDTGDGEGDTDTGDTDTGDTDTGDTDTGDTGDTDTGDGDSACVFPLVELQTGQDPTCSGDANTHAWPVGMRAEDCHGWTATDTADLLHENSAKAISCNPDGSFTFTQFAGNLDCSGEGVVKTFAMGQCEQDTPPVLYTIGTNLTCCLDPQASGCVTGLPSVSVPGGSVWLNGRPCD